MRYSVRLVLTIDRKVSCWGGVSPFLIGLSTSHRLSDFAWKEKTTKTMSSLRPPSVINEELITVILVAERPPYYEIRNFRNLIHRKGQVSSQSRCSIVYFEHRIKGFASGTFG